MRNKPEDLFEKKSSIALHFVALFSIENVSENCDLKKERKTRSDDDANYGNLWSDRFFHKFLNGRRSIN